MRTGTDALTPHRRRLRPSLAPRRWLFGTTALLLAGCQPQARRLLLLDEALSQGAELEATARPWHDAGYRVEYRRFYPHLTRIDLDRYRVVMVLGGHRPLAPSDALGVGDLAILGEWTLRGGVVVLGYPPEGDGAFDRWVMNQWLAWSGAGITIGDFALRDTALAGRPPSARAGTGAGLRGTGLDPFPVGPSDALLVADEAQVLARVGDGVVSQLPGHPPESRDGAPVAAASRPSSGLIVVLSRPTLAAVGPSDSLDRAAARPSATAGTRAFLTALARWTRRPAEWARIPEVGPRARLRLMGGPLPVSSRAPQVAPPPGVTTERLARRAPPEVPHAAGVPGWIAREGVRALEGDFPALRTSTGSEARLAAIDSLSRLLDIGAFNTLVTNAHVAPLADSGTVLRGERDALRAAWQQVTGRLQATSVHWIPLVRASDLAPPPDSGSDERCPLDPAWWSRLASGARVLARLAAGHSELIPAIGFALDDASHDWGGPAFCDAAWQAALSALQPDSTLTRERVARLSAVPRAARYDSLLDGGLLAAYDAGLAGVVAQRATALRNEVRRIRRDLLFALVVVHSPTDWLTRSLVRGLSAAAAPVLVFSPDPRTRELFAAAGDTSLVHAIRLDPALLLSGAAGLGAAVFHEQDGFWVGPAEALLVGPSDSLARQVRRLTKD